MDDQKIRCNRCGWVGMEEDLDLDPLFDDSGDFAMFVEHCPHCGRTDALMDLP